jgi:hypothetical protein
MTGTTGLDTAGMKLQSNFSTWDLAGTWIIYDTFTNPLLRSFMTPLTVTANNITKAYDGLASTATGVSYSITPNSNLLGTFNWGGVTNAGTYLPSANSGLYSNQQGYIISYVNGTLTINPKVVSLSGTKIYDGNATFTGGTNLSVITGVSGQSLGLSGIASTANKNVGNINLLNAGTLALSDGTGGLATNYTLTGVGLTGVVAITPLALTGAAIATASSIYGDALTPGAVTFTNVLGTDAVTSTASVVSLPANQSTSNHLNAGSYTQTATTLSGADKNNYSFAGFTSTANNYTVSPLALTGAAIADASSIYGATVIPGAVSFGNIFSGDVVTSTASIVSPVNSTSGHLNAGTYKQTATTLVGADAGNYSLVAYITPTNTYTVSKLALTGASIAAASSTYASALTPGAVSFTNIQTTDDVSSVASVNTGATSASGNFIVGDYTQTAGTTLGGADKNNYSFAGFTSTANYAINPLELTVAANNVYKSFGAPDNLTYSVTGLASGDTTSSVISGSLIRNSGEDVGVTYTVTQGTLAANSNYNMTFANGTLQIVPLVEPWQPTTLFTQTGTTLPPTLPSQLAQLDSQQARPLTAYASNDGSPGEITQQWGSGNGPAVTIVDGGVRMPDDKDDERKDRR